MLDPRRWAPIILALLVAGWSSRRTPTSTASATPATSARTSPGRRSA